MIKYVNNDASRNEAIDYINSLDLKGNVYKLQIINKRGKRSVNQNSLMWLYLECISQETGNDRDDLHNFFKEKFIGWEKIVIFGEESMRLKGTSKLDTKQFTHYLDKIVVFAASELGVELPNPSDKHFEDFKDYYSKFL
jgi:hypothetical protein